MPRSNDPGESTSLRSRARCPAFSRCRCCLPRHQPRRPLRQSPFRGSIPRPARPLSTLRERRHRRPRKTRFRLPISQLGRSGLSPAGCNPKFSGATTFLSGQTYPGALMTSVQPDVRGPVVVDVIACAHESVANPDREWCLRPRERRVVCRMRGSGPASHARVAIAIFGTIAISSGDWLQCR